jgi:sirohydrochlorin cobaltochelatase
MKAIILFAHGSKDPLWHAPIKAIAQRTQELAPQVLVRCAYLELTPPTLMQVVDELQETGFLQVQIIPLFLGLGKHAREDLPRLIEEIKTAYPNVSLFCAPSIGEEERVINLIAEIAIKHS